MLLKLARRAPGPSLCAREIEILSASVLQERFFALAARHGVQGLILATLADPQRAALVPTKLADRVGVSLRALQLRALLWDLERDRLVACLNAAGLGPVVLKGAALRQAVYTQSAQRPLADVDLLLPEKQLEDAIEALKGIGYQSPSPEQTLKGYREHHFHIRLANANGFIVELHWGLIRPDRPFRLDAGAFIRRSILSRRATGPDLRVPSPEDMVLHMTSQNLGTFCLGRLVDIDRVVAGSAGLDWGYVRHAAEAGGLEVALAVTLQLCRSLLDTPVREGLVERLSGPYAARFHLALMRPARWPFAEGPGRVAANQLRLLWCVSGWRVRLNVIREVLEGRGDPLRWLWEGRPYPKTQAPAPLKGVASCIKLAGYQLWLYAAAAIASLTPRGRSELRFWNRGRRLGSTSEVRRCDPPVPTARIGSSASYSIRSSRSSSRS